MGGLGDGYYAALSGSGDLGGNLYKDGSIELQQSIASLSVAYRIIDDRRGFLDIYAGARYNFLGVQMDLSTDSSGINALGVGISDAVASIKSLASANVASTVESELLDELFASKSKTKQSVENLKVLERLAGDSRGPIPRR